MATKPKKPAPVPTHHDASVESVIALLRSSPDLASRILYLAEPVAADTAISDARAAAAALLPLIGGFAEERFAVLALDRRQRLIDSEVLTIGSDGFTIVDPKQVYRWALTRKRPVHTIIVGHNHPSGDSTPSQPDIDVTRRLLRAGEAIGIALLDHVIIGDKPRSMREYGDVSFEGPAYRPVMG